MDLGHGSEGVAAVWPGQEPLTPAGPSLHDSRVVARQSNWLMAQPADFAQRLLAHASLRQYRKRQVISGIDDENPGLHFLIRGAVDVWVPARRVNSFRSTSFRRIIGSGESAR